MFLGSDSLEESLRAVGELLQAVNAKASVVVVGGATLNILGMVARTTQDVDVIAQAYRDESGSLKLAHADPFSKPLQAAIATVARDYGLPGNWMNAAVGKQWSLGLPPWIEKDITWRNYANLEVGLVGRRTLIALKLFAAADRDPSSVHTQDLLQLEATDDELAEAAAWVKTQDGSPEFPPIVETVVEHVKQRRH